MEAEVASGTVHPAVREVSQGDTTAVAFCVLRSTVLEEQRWAFHFEGRFLRGSKQHPYRQASVTNRDTVRLKCPISILGSLSRLTATGLDLLADACFLQSKVTQASWRLTSLSNQAEVRQGLGLH